MPSMPRPSLPIVFAALVPLFAAAQTPQPASSPLADRLAQAAAASSLDNPALKPWHLKLAVQFFTPKGVPAGLGIIEAWWAGPQRNKIIYTTPDYNATVLTTEKGTTRTAGTSPVPPKLELLLQQTLHPVPLPDVVAASTPELRPETFGKLKLDCIMLSQSMLGQTSPTPLGLFPTYCLTPDKDTLRLAYDYGSQLLIRDGIGNFQGVSVAVDVTIVDNKVKTENSHLAQLETIPETAQEALFLPSPDLTSPPETAAANGTPHPKAPVKISGSLLAGRKIGGDIPRYPQSAKERHVSGTVIFRAIIGRDGHIHQLTPVSSADQALTEAALAAVRTWTYKPYLLNGEPTEIDTTITVNFNIGG